jgi:hypothetical protein
MFGKSQRQSKGGSPGRPANEIQIAVSGLRAELLETATLYGVLCAAEELSGSENRPPAWSQWLDWLRYTRRVDAWLTGGTRRDLARRLIDAGQVSETAFDEFAKRAGQEDWRRRLEGLAESSRAVEELGGQPLAEVVGQPNRYGVQLRGAVQDSLLLIVFGEERDHGLCATAEETLWLLAAAREEGIWRFMEPSGRFAADDAAPEVPRPPATPAAGMTGLIEALDSVWRKTLMGYQKLDPNGEELSEEERGWASDRLIETASCLRRLDRNPDLAEGFARSEPPETEHIVGFTTMVLRIAQGNLILALSESRELRERASAAASFEKVTRGLDKFWSEVEARRRFSVAQEP